MGVRGVGGPAIDRDQLEDVRPVDVVRRPRTGKQERRRLNKPAAAVDIKVLGVEKDVVAVFLSVAVPLTSSLVL
jgi:hypothetical protein